MGNAESGFDQVSVRDALRELPTQYQPRTGAARWCTLDDTAEHVIERILQLMTTLGVHALPVVEATPRYKDFGIVGAAELVVYQRTLFPEQVEEFRGTSLRNLCRAARAHGGLEDLMGTHITVVVRLDDTLTRAGELLRAYGKKRKRMVVLDTTTGDVCHAISQSAVAWWASEHVEQLKIPAGATAGSIGTRVEGVARESTAGEAIEALYRSSSVACPIVSDGVFVGDVSFDLLRRRSSFEPSELQRPLQEWVSEQRVRAEGREVVSVDAEASIAEVARVMKERAVSHVHALHGGTSPASVVSVGDLLCALLRVDGT